MTILQKWVRQHFCKIKILVGVIFLHFKPGSKDFEEKKVSKMPKEKSYVQKNGCQFDKKA